jgi:hydroxymethylpyrimidine/phosphomethylpyrimidine kinase
VLDPVMVATSGDRLMTEECVQVLVRALFAHVTVVTPNLDEAELLLGRRITSAAAMAVAADDLLALGAQAVLLKGAHLPGKHITDMLAMRGRPLQRFQSPRLHSNNVHGTGCTLSSAVAAYLALGLDLTHAVQLARRYVRRAIACGTEVQTGRGHGPLNHAHAPHRLLKIKLG